MEDTMAKQLDRGLFHRPANRRSVIPRGAGAAVLGTRAFAAPGARRAGEIREQDGDIVFLSSQLTPIEEAEKMRNSILANFEGTVEFVPEDPGPFADRIAAEAQSGEGSV